jgi:tetratricopeptide (TPR) repeat protein
VARALSGQASVLIDEGRPEEALPLIEKSIVMCKNLGKADITADLLNLGLIYFNRFEFDTALHYYRQAQELALKLGDCSRVVEAKGFQAQVHSHVGNVKEAMELFDEEERELRRRNDTFRLCECLYNQSFLSRYHLRNFDRAKAQIREALAIAREEGLDCFIDDYEQFLGCIEQSSIFGAGSAAQPQ